jgi:hypothetical protein
MSLLTPNPPHAAAEAFRNGLPAFLSGGPPDTVVSETFVGSPPPIPSAADIYTGSGHGSGTAGGPNIPSVLQGFVLSLRDAANNTGVVSPAHVGWRFFAGGARNKTVLGSVVQRRHAWKLVAVHYGNVVWETLNASQLLNSTPPAQVQAEDYELRLLAIPGLNLEVFWLGAQKAGSVDLIVSVPSALSRFIHLPTPSGPLEIPAFLAEIRPLAASLLTMAPGYGA